MVVLRWFGDAWRQIDAEVQATGPDPRATRRCAGSLLLAAVVLTGIYYFSDAGSLRWLCERTPALEALPTSRFWHLYALSWWSGIYLLGYLAVPLAVLRFAFDVPLAEHGLGLGDTRQKLAVYLGLLALVLPVVIAASFRPDFSSYYPFYLDAGRSLFDLLAWEGLYVAQFVAVEYFYRGFLLAACRPRMGSLSIFVSVVPYCMVHFGKPLGEALGAIVAGVVLGTLALRTRSLWGGVGVHAGVAVTMDAAALLQGEGLPSRWWP